ncbi:MAG: carbohydrate binding family 9 domain-containing protein [Candidatus Eisenbacteria bacterium]|nr:carbohydrate binding family 9 domain-containing protein [Candidatus Eisenbacteria bacterium]
MRLLLSLLLTAALSGAAAAQPTTPSATADTTGYSSGPVRATRTAQPILLDGRLDEPVWNTAEAFSDFKQKEPDQGASTRQKTEVRVAYDDDALYVGARMYDTQPDSIVARLVRRDGDVSSDVFFVFLDPFHDKRTGYYFGLSAAGTQLDGVFLNDGWDDDSWDGVWNGRVARDEQGWVAEMRIPFSQMRFANADPMVWGVNFKRFVNRSSEEDLLAFPRRGQSGFVSRFPELHGLDGVKPRRAYEITPYVTSKGDFFKGESDFTNAGGADLRTTLGPRLSLNATINPDFGQVEIDPAVVNLSDVETYFGEKRPFFTEGFSVFRCGNNGANDYWGFNWPEPTFLYTRRIGRSPQAGFLADPGTSPLGTSILGAAKVTGQIVPGWDFGMVHAVTARETGTVTDSAGRTQDVAVEPMTYYGVLRGMHSFNKGRQGLGVMNTTAIRSFSDAQDLERFVNKSGVVTAVDGWTFLDGKKNWVISGWAAATQVTGSKDRITALQRSSAHYYQRPDAGHVEVDTNATSLTGEGARVWLNRQNGPWMLNSALGWMSPGFDTNDMGFTSRGDVINGHIGSGYQWNKPRGWRQYQHVIGALAATFDTEGNPTTKMLYAGYNLEQRNHNSWEATLFLFPATVNTRATRGGPIMRNTSGWSTNLHFDSNSKAKRFWYVDVNPSSSEDGGYEFSVSPGVRWKPVSNLAFEFNPSWYRGRTDAQYLTQYADAGASATYGTRYVFAQLDQSILQASLRMDYSITPALSVQLYAQPFITSGDYSGLKYLARPASYEFVSMGTDGSEDFNYRSVRGNAVLRWEYLPGSTFFLVWTQQREDVTDDGRFHLNASLASLGHADAANTILVKVAHHFTM